MKKLKDRGYNFYLIILMHIFLTLIIVGGLWLFLFPNTMYWIEGVSYFSVAEDLKSLYLRNFFDYFEYAGAFLLQFYRWPILGALVSSMLVSIVVVATDCMVNMYDRDGRLSWISSLTGVGAIIIMFKDLSLGWSVLVAVGFIVIYVCMLALFPMMKHIRKDNKIRRGSHRLTWKVLLIDVAIFIIVMAGGALWVSTRPEYRIIERLAKVERLAEQGKWDDLKAELPMVEMVGNSNMRHYALLSLIANDELPENAFAFGLRGPEDFYFNVDGEPELYWFNALFFSELGLYNESIHQLFELNNESIFGVSNRSLRKMIDLCIKVGKRELAEKYITIVEKSPFYGDWAEEKRKELITSTSEKFSDSRISSSLTLSIANEENNLRQGSIGCLVGVGNFIPNELIELLKQDNSNKRFLDILLCSYLGEGKLGDFEYALNCYGKVIYPEENDLPIVYRQALNMIKEHKLESLKKGS